MSRFRPSGSHVFYRKMGCAHPVASHGQGIYLYDTDGKRYIDGSGGALVANVGHNRPEVIEAMERQLRSVAYVHATMFTSEVIERYAAALAQVTSIPDAHFYLLSSGTEVVEGALKLARQLQLARGEDKRHLVIGRWQSYHGMTLGALSVSGRPGLRQPYLPMMADMPHIAPPYPYRDSSSGEQAARRLEQAILEAGPENVAAFIAEPISGASLGAVVPRKEYWPWIREICDRYGVLLIADEVLVGLGRTGVWWGLDHWEVVPDILVTSKGAAGGYFPLGLIATSGTNVDLLYERFGDFNHGGTYSHHAVGAAAGLATLEVIQNEELVQRSARLGTLLGAMVEQELGSHPNAGDIRGRGLFWAIEIVDDRASARPFPASQRVAWGIWRQAFARGLIVYHSQGCADGQNGDLIMLGPPLTVSESELDEIVSLLGAAVRDYFAHEVPAR
jgi:adenosylmethionine-8-amino-7-oxononanoate aminotransferase